MNSEPDPRTHAERAALGVTAGDQQRIGQSVTLARENASDRRPRIQGWEDAFTLLALAAAFDGRERSRYEAEAWLSVLQGVPIADARGAVTQHYRTSRYPVMPADVIQILEEGAS